MDIIELALKKTTSKTNFSFDYIDKMISDWHEKNLFTTEDVSAYLKEQKQKNKELKNFENQQQITIQKYVDTQTNQYSDLSKFYANL